MNEDQLIPFHTTDLTGRRVLVLAPHPDDETIGCGGTLALHIAAGDPVRIVMMTNGAKGDVSGRCGRDDYIAMRRQETLAACACLGVTDVTFWHHEDRELANAASVVPDLVALIDTYSPDLIYAPSPLEFHPDHRAAADFIRAAARCCRTDAEVLFYEVGQPLQADILVDITGVLDKKKQAMRQYRSQLEERPYDDVALALNRFRSLTLPEKVTHAEGFGRYNPAVSIAGIRNMTRWSAGPVATSLMDCSGGYAIAVIVRTQGIRLALLKEALTSISRQSDPCLAVVVVHAGADMLEPVQSVCSQIQGLSYALICADRIENKRGYPLNVGLQYVCTSACSVEAVAFLDDDDILYPEFSAGMIHALKETGADVICAASNRRVPGQAVEEGYRPVSFLNLFVMNFIPINSYVIRRAALANTPVFFDETLDVVEDWHFLLQLLQNGFRFEAIMDTLSEFRIISDGNKPVKDNPEIWEQSHGRIHAYIRDSSFLINGRMIQRLMADENMNADEKTIFLGHPDILQIAPDAPAFSSVESGASVTPAPLNSGSTIQKADADVRVSVIIPLYNHENYIEAAIESVFSQTVRPAEIIVIDDGSVDGSAGKVRRLCKDHPEIIFWSWSNQGAHHTLNAAILRATGDFVSILNSDDCYHPERLAACLAIVRSDPSVDVVVTGMSFLDGMGNAVENPWYQNALTVYKQEGNLSLGLFHANFIVTTSNLFIRRSVFEWIGYFSPLRYTHDLEFCLRVILGKRHIHFLDRPLLFYRLHQANTIVENKARVDVERAAVFAFFLHRQALRAGTDPARHSWMAPYTEVLGQQGLLELVENFLKILAGGHHRKGGAVADPLPAEFLDFLFRLGAGWFADEAGSPLLDQFVSARNAYLQRKKIAGGEPRLISELKTNIQWLSDQRDAWKKTAEIEAEHGKLLNQELEQMCIGLEQMRIGISWMTDQRDAWEREAKYLSAEFAKCHAALQGLNRSRIFRLLILVKLLKIEYVLSSSTTKVIT